MKNRTWEVRGGGIARGGVLCLLALVFCLGLGSVPVSEAQQTGLQSCYVGGITITTIASCVSLLQGATTGTLFGGVITTSFPEHIQTLPWDPGLFTGTLQLGKAPIAHGSLNTCTLSALNCWVTEVPIIIGSGMSIVGSGKVPGSNLSFAEGTAITPIVRASQRLWAARA